MTGKRATPTSPRRIAAAVAACAALAALPGSVDALAHPAKKPAPAKQCRGVVVALGQSLQRAVDRHSSGTVFCIAPGTHRLRNYVIPKNGDQFVGMPGAILDGSVPLTQFTHDGSTWTTKLDVPMNPVLAGQCGPNRGDTCRYANDVYVDSRPLRREDSADHLGPRSFAIDGDTLSLGADPTGHTVEIGVATRAFKGWDTGVDNVTVRNLVIQKFANEGGIAAVNARASWRVLDCRIQLNHGVGVQDANLIEGNVITMNGELGIAGSFTDGARIEHNVISYNNYVGFDPNYFSGGGKWVKSKNLVVSHNVVRGNHGPGLWTDGDSIDVLYADNLVVGNTGPGIFHEISYRAVIRGNTVRDNGSEDVGWLDGAGILLNSSGDVEIANNVLSGNRNGIGIVQTDRGSGDYGPYVAQNDYVHDNSVTMIKGRSGLVTSMDDPSYFTSRNNRFAANHYYLGCAGTYFAWSTPDGELTWAQWRATGNDAGATMQSLCDKKN
jgi:parallel beta-helix repeat protein